MKNELLKGLSDEQIAKVKACKSQEEIMALAEQEDIKLTEEQLDAINGGGCSDKTPNCPRCGSEYVDSLGVYDGVDYNCRKCYYRWTVHSNNKR